MKRILFVFMALVLAILACDLDAPPAPTPEGPPPTLPPIQPLDRAIPSSGSQTILLEDDLNNSSGEWAAWAEEPSTASLSVTDNAVRAEIDTARQSAAVLIRRLIDLPDYADGMTLTMQAEKRPFNMVVGVKEEDGSWYHTFLRLGPEEGPRTVEISFDWLRPAADSEDENDILDRDQVVELDIVDISGFVGPVGEGVLEIQGVVLWQGTVSRTTACITRA